MMKTTQHRIPRVLSIFMLVMINIAAICSMKNWPVIAEYGLTSLFYLFAGTIGFFLPVSLVSAELATGWPKAGGVYAWIKEAFGHRAGFLAAWLLWIENIVWYPTILAFIAGTLSYAIDPTWATSTAYNAWTIVSVFWVLTLCNLFGMRTSAWMSSAGAFAGTLIPGMCIIGLGALWFWTGRPLQVSLEWRAFLPDFQQTDQLVFFAGVVLSLAGMEMSAVHARDVHNPQKSYPRAILFSGILITALSALGITAIVFVIPQNTISLTAGSMQAFEAFLTPYGLLQWLPFIAILVLIGALGSVSTWIVGPCKGLLAAAQGGDLPSCLKRVNHQGMPIPLMVAQATVVSILALLFYFMPTVNSAFWLLVVLAAQVYLIMYVLLFLSAIRLRYTRPDVKRAYTIPFGYVGMWVVAATGILCSTFTFIIGFFPPSQVGQENRIWYIGILLIGITLICATPYLILLGKRHFDKVR